MLYLQLVVPGHCAIRPQVLGIRRNTLPAKTPSAEEQTIRIRELERENAELRTANDILKDALGFFAKDRKK